MKSLRLIKFEKGLSLLIFSLNKQSFNRHILNKIV